MFDLRPPFQPQLPRISPKKSPANCLGSTHQSIIQRVKKTVFVEEIMPAKLRLSLFMALLSWMACSWGIASSPVPEANKFVRISHGEDKEPLALQTAIVGFRVAGAEQPGVRVDLIGAIHIGDKSYYDELNRRFRGYDAVLYELVAREEANIPQPGQNPGSFVGGMQVGMKSLLELEYQLDGIDYTPKNMVHADMSPEEFAATMKRRNESFAGMFFRILGRAMAEQAEDPFGTSDFQIMAAMFAKDRPQRLKLAMAKQFANMEGELSLFDGPDGSTIITERNKKAFEVLGREMGKGHQRIAVFYGAGHLPDMQRRLEQDFRMQRTGTEWVSAWALTPSNTPSAPRKK